MVALDELPQGWRSSVQSVSKRISKVLPVINTDDTDRKDQGSALCSPASIVVLRVR